MGFVQALLIKSLSLLCFFQPVKILKEGILVSVLKQFRYHKYNTFFVLWYNYNCLGQSAKCRSLGIASISILYILFEDWHTSASAISSILPLIHNQNLITHVLHHRQIMWNKNIGKPEILF
jgi:hypothetical protein